MVWVKDDPIVIGLIPVYIIIVVCHMTFCFITNEAFGLF